MTTSVANRLLLGFGSGFLLLICTVAVAFHGFTSLNDQIERMAEKDWKKVSLAKDIAYAVNDVSRQVFIMFLDEANLAEKKERIQSHRQSVVEKMAVLDKTIYHPQGRELFDKFKTARTAFADTYPKVIELLEKGQRAEATALFVKTGMPQMQAYVNSIDAFARFQGELFEQGATNARETYGQVRLLLIGALLLSALASIALTTWIVRSITRPLGGEPEQAKQAVIEIAGGNLTIDVPVKSGDRDSLLAAMSAMRDHLRTMIDEVKRGADNLGGSAEALSSASEQVARGSSEQSESAASMAAAVEQLTTSIAHVAASAGDARNISTGSGERAEAGKQVMEQTAVEMEGIATTVGDASRSIDDMSQSSQRISGIVQVIKDVADQTNLLALNAAIEAARAGEQGRGFAVVADEVRKLAERTANATTEIGAMIGNVQSGAQTAVAAMERIVAQVETGVSRAREASVVMGEITASTHNVVSAVNEISYALEEQSSASQQLAQNVERIAQMSEQNSQATRETARTAREMEGVASELRQGVARFRT